MGRWNGAKIGTQRSKCSYKYSETKARGMHSKAKKTCDSSTCSSRAQKNGLRRGRQHGISQCLRLSDQRGYGAATKMQRLLKLGVSQLADETSEAIVLVFEIGRRARVGGGC